MAVASNYSRVGNALQLGGGDVAKVCDSLEFGPNARALLCDDYGDRDCTFVKNVSTSDLVQGELASRYGDANGLTTITNILSGTTLLAVTTGLTAGALEGAILWVKDDAGGAGAAPEGQGVPVKKNTATTITAKDETPLTAPLAVNDDLEIVSTYNVRPAAAGDLARSVKGVVLSPDGLPQTKYGWVQYNGVCRALMVAATVLAPLNQVIAGARRLTVTGAASPFNLICGASLTTVSADQVAGFGLVDLRCASAAAIFSDQDAKV